MPTLEFSDLIRLIDERSGAFRAALAAAPSLDAPVPTCPGWTLFDLARHLGEGQRTWAAIVAAGPASAKTTPERVPAAPPGRQALLAWLFESTQQLLSAVRAAGPDRGCWTWWAESQSPSTSGAVARHRLQEVAVHTYDAQLGSEPLPTEVALDGVDEFLATCCAGPYAWPHKPAVVDYHATEGRSWRLWLAADGVRVASPDAGPADASLRGTASDLVLALYLRIPVDSLEVSGDGQIFDQLIDWDPEE
ncbi:uncharacterized protein (TIGR03083 family) [Actinoplanes tereljensis]|uniref:Maleylpyruvate isomerase family mycothiol-dependent enzyme n=1 Tax=Paractinoplanes tereljensis TaxID=571912 RepID=A0A919TTF6_9ACTN|nr:maleylpyruvate isomerase N-terminal domain-containing protein [Actinoplanes tereljensis]GIF21636.1 hypothetical protein Ate02nite_43660 [Actinoplanes tereljensis]